MVADRIAAHPEVTVLHLGCGLDSRGLRLDLSPTVEWYDIDFPEVIDLRRRLCPESEHHHTIASSVTDPALLDAIPGDQPVLVVAEGLTMYLTEQDGPALLRRITEHFPRGELVCDVRSRLASRLGHLLNKAVQAAGTHLTWGLNSGGELARAVPGLVIDEEITFFEIPEIERLHPLYRAALQAMAHIRTFRRMGRVLRMHFGD